jgi:uncharacterized DUF497 family protein
MKFAWDGAKSERNEWEQGPPFQLAVLLFDGPVIERVDVPRDNGETRDRGIGVLGELILHCVGIQHREMRRIGSLRYANRKERDACRATYPC